MLNVDVGGVKGRDDVPGWKTLDVRKEGDFIYDLNSGKPFPFGNKEVDNFYCSHTLEHVKPSLVLYVLKEFRRPLKSGGRIRIVVPDLETAVKWYLKNPEMLLQKKGRARPFRPGYYPETRMGRLLSWFRTDDKVKDGIAISGHKMGFDFELLQYYLVKAGFRKVVRLVCERCSPVFKGKDKIRYRDFSIFVEAKK